MLKNYASVIEVAWYENDEYKTCYTTAVQTTVTEDGRTVYTFKQIITGVSVTLETGLNSSVHNVRTSGDAVCVGYNLESKDEG